MITKRTRPTLTAAVLLWGLCGLAGGALVAQDEAPRLGLSSGRELGLPGVPYDTPVFGPHRGWVGRHHHSRPHGGAWYGHPYGYGHGYGWAPWHRIAPSERWKTEPVLRHGRLGVRYGIGAVGTGTDIGLTLPGEPEDAEATPQVRDLLSISPWVADALQLMKRGEYASAGRLLSTQLKAPPAPLEVYVVIAELLVATGKLDAAGKIFRHGIEGAESLDMLSGVDIRKHFPSPEFFMDTMKALSERAKSTQSSADIELLAAAFRVLSADPGGMEALQGMRDEAATRLYLHFADMLFEESPEPEPEPLDKRAVEPKE